MGGPLTCPGVTIVVILGIVGIEGRVSAEGQLNENCALGASLPFSPILVVVEGFANNFSFSTISNLTVDTHLVFRLVYTAVSILTGPPLTTPFLLLPSPATRPVIVDPEITSVVPVLPTLAVADNGIFRFFLFFKLKSSLPRDEVDDPASSTSSSESDNS